ncbi:MAG: radical SAM protein [Kiritimatiellae bacterium]|nr:radical SAM protein [Kiritimatiellia bacterium]
MAALRRLPRHGVGFNVLAAVHTVNASRPLEVERHLRDLGVRYIRFIPIIERVPDAAQYSTGLDTGRAGPAPRRTRWSVAPAEYGRFLIAVFEEGRQRDRERLTLQIIESAIAARLGAGATVCQFAPECGRCLVVETNGDVYACDRDVQPYHHRSNLLDSPLADILDSPAPVRFGRDKADRLSWTCRTCAVLSLCGGDCPKHRWLADADDPHRPRSVRCEAYRRFFNHSWATIEESVLALICGTAPNAEGAGHDNPVL